MKGIDIYHGTGRPDFAKVRTAGIDCVILKATEGVNYTDGYFAVNAEAAKVAGLSIGAYHFLRSTPIEQQCHDFLAAIASHGPYAMLAIDVENPYQDGKVIPEISNLGKNGITDRVITLNSAIRAAGYTCPVYVYASAAWLRSLIDVAACRKAGLLIWMAAYGNDTPDSTDRSADCDMWQWCSDGKVPGVTGNTDCDVCYRGIGAAAPSKPVAPQNVNAWYRVRVGGVWLPEVCNLTDFAGRSNGTPITDVAVRVSVGTVKYRVHVLGGHWLPYVTGCDINDSSNGYAGDGKPVDAIEAYYYTPDSIRPTKCAKYRVAPGAGGYYPWQYDDQTTGGQDGYAGSFGREIGKLQICID